VCGTFISSSLPRTFALLEISPSPLFLAVGIAFALSLFPLTNISPPFFFFFPFLTPVTTSFGFYFSGELFGFFSLPHLVKQIPPPPPPFLASSQHQPSPVSGKATFLFTLCPTSLRFFFPFHLGSSVRTRPFSLFSSRKSLPLPPFLSEMRGVFPPSPLFLNDCYCQSIFFLPYEAV